MPSQSFPIHITEFLRRLCKHHESELGRLEENPEDTYEGFFDKPRPYDSVPDWLATRSGEKLEDVVRYMHRCEHGCAWGEVKRLKDKQGNYEIWPDISAIAQRIAAYFQPNVMNELLALFCEVYPIEAREMDLQGMPVEPPAIGPTETTPSKTAQEAVTEKPAGHPQDSKVTTGNGASGESGDGENRKPLLPGLNDIPPLDEESGEWVLQEKAAELASIKRPTLTKDRNKPSSRKADDELSGIDHRGRMWRKKLKNSQKVWYLKSSLSFKAQ